MLPPLPVHPSSASASSTSSHKSQYTSAQLWLPSAASNGKPAGGIAGAGAGHGLGYGPGPPWPAVDGTAGVGVGVGAAAEAGARPYPSQSAAASSGPRASGSAGSNQTNRGNKGKRNAGSDSNRNASGSSGRSSRGHGSGLPAVAADAPTGADLQRPPEGGGAPPLEAAAAAPPADASVAEPHQPSAADGDGDAEGAPADGADAPVTPPDSPQAQQLQQPNLTPQQLAHLQQMQALAANPYLQILSQAGVGGAGLAAYAGGLAAAAQAAHEVAAAALRRRVQRDIKRMLAGNRAYQQHHVRGPAAMSAESLAALAQPKQRPGSRPDPQAVANLPDPVEWARWKTDQLVISRLTEERRQAERAEEKRVQEGQLEAFRLHRAATKAAKAEAKARAAAEESAYRANMSAFLNHKGALELEEYKKKRDEQQERLALMRSRQVKSLSAHHH